MQEVNVDTSRESRKCRKRSSGNKRHSAAQKTATLTKNETEEANQNNESNIDSQNVVSCYLPIQIKSESGVIDEIVVECAVCHEKVESGSWISHSNMKHQYLAWHSGEEFLVSVYTTRMIPYQGYLHHSE